MYESCFGVSYISLSGIHFIDSIAFQKHILKPVTIAPPIISKTQNLVYQYKTLPFNLYILTVLTLGFFKLS